MRRAFLAMVLAILAAALGSCGGGGQPSRIFLPNVSPGQLQHRARHGRAITFLSDVSAVLSSAGDTYQFSAEIQNPSGAVVPGKLSWASSDPAVVSVDQTGKATALSSLGSATITVSAPGTQPQSATVIIAHPNPGTVLVSSSDVISSSTGQVVLKNDPITSSIQPGDVIVSGSKAGLLGKVTTVSVFSTQVVVQYTQASLTQAFSQVAINVTGSPEQLDLTLFQGKAQVADRAGRLLRTLSASQLECKDNSGNLINLKVSGPSETIAANIQPQFLLQTQGLTVQQLQLLINLTISGTLTPGSLSLAGSQQVGFTCSIDLGSVPLVPIPIGPIIIGPSLDTQFGLEGSITSNASIVLVGPQITVTDAIQDGLSYNGGNLQLVADDRPTVAPSLQPLNVTSSTSLSGSIGPFLKFTVGMAAYAGPFQIINADFADIGAKGDFNVDVPAAGAVGTLSYQPPSWDATFSLEAGLDAQVSAGALQPLLDDLGISSLNFNVAAFTDNFTLAKNPVPTIQVSPSVATSGSVALESDLNCATLICLPYVGGSNRVDFWAFQSGAGTGTKIGSSAVGAGNIATTTWSPTAQDNGNYSVYAYFYDEILGQAGLPYASATSAPLSINVSASPTPSPTPSPSPAPSSSPTPPPTPTPTSAPPPTTSLQPIWSMMGPEPGGCSAAFTSGYVLSAPIDQSSIGCGWNSAGPVTINGTVEPLGTVDYVWFHNGTSVSYSFTVPAGATERISYGIPQGGYYNNAPATISGIGSTTTVCDGGSSPSDCSQLPGGGATTPTDDILWTSSPLSSGSYTVTITSGGNTVNVYGLWVGQ